ncbi:MAG: hypothetical protein ACI9FJ_002937 [Alteromonadaceae bacterium]|jgi:hypothetical protein
MCSENDIFRELIIFFQLFIPVSFYVLNLSKLPQAEFTGNLNVPNVPVSLIGRVLMTMLVLN